MTRPAFRCCARCHGLGETIELPRQWIGPDYWITCQRCKGTGKLDMPPPTTDRKISHGL